MGSIILIVYIVVSFILLLTLLLKRKYKILGIGIYLLFLCSIYILCNTLFHFNHLSFSINRLSSVRERLYIVPFVKPLQEAVRMNGSVAALVFSYCKYVSIGAALTVAITFLKPHSKNILKKILLAWAILLFVTLTACCFSFVIFDSGAFVSLLGGIFIGYILTKDIKKRIEKIIIYTEEDYE